MFPFAGQCTRMSIASMLMCTNSTKFAYTRIIDTAFQIDSGEYINATLVQMQRGSTAYTIESILTRSFRSRTVSHRRLGEIHRNILTLRVAYANSLQSYSEQQLHEGMWGGGVNRSVNNIFYESSFGKVTFTRNASETKTIVIQPSSYFESIRASGCNIDLLLYATNIAAYRQSNVNLSSFSHVEYIIPLDFGATCAVEIGDGIAPIQCHMYECFTVIRSPTVYTRAHELGHNFGLNHAYGCGPGRGRCSSARMLEYGDATAIMGGMFSRDTTGGFIAPNRMNLGWVGNITDGAGDGRFEIGALASWPSDTPHIVRVPSPCPSLYEILTGDECEILLSYRAPVGIDVDIRGGSYSQTVSVHIQSPTVRKTLLLVSLNLGDSYPMPTGQVVSVIATATTHAVVNLCRSSSPAGTHTSHPNMQWLVVFSLGAAMAGTLVIARVAFALNRIHWTSSTTGEYESSSQKKQGSHTIYTIT